MKPTSLWFIALLLAGAISTSRSQSLQPFTLNVGGGSGTINGNIFTYSIGEMVAISTVSANNITLTQGVLQPSDNQAILPVTLIRFQGTKMNGYNKLTWATGFESGNTRFELQRSPDAVQFTTIYTGTATGSANGHTYTYDDRVAFGSKVYYRLKIIEDGGTIRYSSIVVLYSFEEASWTVFPNPAKAGGILKIEVQNSNNLKTVTLLLTDAAGRTILSRPQVLASGSGVQTISLPAPTAAGTYLLSLAGIAPSSFQKIIIR